jgi:hypothetical protein
VKLPSTIQLHNHGDEPFRNKGGAMPKNSRSYKLRLMRNVSNQKEKNHSSHGAMHEVGRQYRPGEFAMLSDTAIEAVFEPRKAWLRMLHEHNSEILNTYKELFWLIPPFCMFPLELAQRSFVVYIECQQCITESIEQQIKAANLSAQWIERTHSGDSIEHAMDIVIGAEGEPWVEARAARAARAA